MKDLIKQMLAAAEYQDGSATIPAYLLEQLAIEAGISVEQHYTEAA